MQLTLRHKLALLVLATIVYVFAMPTALRDKLMGNTSPSAPVAVPSPPLVTNTSVNSLLESSKIDIKKITADAEHGVASAQYLLGTMYHDGEGVAQNYAQSFAWHTKAANQDVAEAQRDLGKMYYYGEGVAQDKLAAMTWIAKAAEQGDHQAQTLLGYAYTAGEGVKQDWQKAYIWFAVSTDDSASQKNMVQTAAAQLTPEALANAQREATALRDKIAQHAADKKAGKP